MGNKPDFFPGAWGKYTVSKEGVNQYLDLESHCADVAAVCLCLLRLPVWKNRFEKLAGRGFDRLDLERLALVAYLHDIGKCAAGFWLKQFDRKRDDGQHDVSTRLKVVKAMRGQLSECGHTRVALMLLSRTELGRFFFSHSIAKALFSDPENLKLLRASISHHGTPIPEELPANEGCSWTWSAVPEYGYAPFQALKKLLDTAEALFPNAVQVDSSLPTNDEFVHAFCGLVSLADWIGSNPEPGFFPYDLVPCELRWEAALERATEVLKRMRIDCADAIDSLSQSKLDFGDLFFDEASGPWQPTEVQSRAADPDLGPLVIVEDETGAGKTEAALWRFKTLFEAGQVDSLAFVLPTRVSAVALAERIEGFIQRLFPDAKLRPNTVTAVPGYLVSDGLVGEPLARFEVLWPDHESEISAHRHWAAENSKRYLAAAIAIGTVDQVLMAGLMTRHAHLRGTSLLRSLLVVDEVHASDIYMSRVLENLLARQVSAGGHGLLLSATLGNSARQRFLYCHLPYRQRYQALKAAPDGDSVPYPAISSQHQPPIGFEPSGQSKRVAIEPAPIINDAEAIAQRAAEAARQGARVLVIRNTVDNAIAVQQALEASDLPEGVLFSCNGWHCPHHGRFAALDRKVLDRQVEQRFGKTSPSGACVLVGTQTLEQSLDIDADLMISDLCPMDVLLQRIGRLHRHRNRERPAGFEQPRLIVLVPQDRDLSVFLSRSRGASFGLGTVYENLLSIEATWRELERVETLSIPEQNRHLVERTTNESRLEKLAEELGPKWTDKWGELVGKGMAQSQEASVRLLDWGREFEAYAENQQILTRLGRLPRLLKIPETESPFGELLTELQIPDHLWPDGCELESIEQIEWERTGSLRFLLDDVKYSYDCYGLQRGNGNE